MLSAYLHRILLSLVARQPATYPWYTPAERLRSYAKWQRYHYAYPEWSGYLIGIPITPMHVGAYLRIASGRYAACRTSLAILKAMEIRPLRSSTYVKYVTWITDLKENFSSDFYFMHMSVYIYIFMFLATKLKQITIAPLLRSFLRKTSLLRSKLRCVRDVRLKYYCQRLSMTDKTNSLCRSLFFVAYSQFEKQFMK